MNDIRPATAADLDIVVVLELEAFTGSAWSPRTVEDEFAGLGDTREIWLAEEVTADGTTAVGYAVGRFVDDVADVQRVAVLPSRRRHGVGRRLLEEIESEAKRRGADRLMLEVGADNAAACGLYEQSGFSVIDRRPRYYPGDVDALVMSKPLRSEGGR